jgi:hypothetical protein
LRNAHAAFARLEPGQLTTKGKHIAADHVIAFTGFVTLL